MFVLKFLKRNGVHGSLHVMLSILISRLFLSENIRIVRIPYYIRGSSNIKWGKEFTSGVNLRIDADPINNIFDKFVLTIGNNVEVNDYVHIGAVESVCIGNNVLIASKVFISDHNHGSYSGELHSSPDLKPSKRQIVSSPIVIEDNVWIGELVSILPGVTIGKGSIIGANSVVSKSIPPNCIAAGIPAKVIKQFNFRTNKWEKI
jgi:acetyltransferase-like isoleucine patch superfamily enzyme